MPDAQPLFLVYVRGATPCDRPLHFGGEAFLLADDLFLVRSELTRSRLYHQIKQQLATNAALLVAPLADAPKFKSSNRGALKWLRESSA